MGKLHCCDPARVRTDYQDWEEVDCYLFAESITCFRKEDRSSNSYLNGKSTPEPPRCELRAHMNLRYLQHITMNRTVITFSTGLSGLENGSENWKLHIDFNTSSQAMLWLQSVKDICSSLGPNPVAIQVIDCADEILRIDDFGETEIRSSASTCTDTASFTQSSASDYRQAFPVNRRAPPTRKSAKYEWRPLTDDLLRGIEARCNVESPPNRKSKKHAWRRLTDSLSRGSDGSIKLLV